ncbi:MAG: ABC transporter ATP-binding protein [Chlamydiae bacterium]|jgi:ABC-2 type transport system ATP-binding protein|nr:ABC transporter ATP-binding protein [Chlamydiota bacterium]
MSDVLLKIENIKKVYFKKNQPVKEALSGITLDLYEGEILSLLGVNGAGKTTLSSIIATLHPPTSGNIFWKGSSIYDDLLSYRTIVGFCPQKPNLDPLLTLEENLFYAGKFFRLSTKEANRRKDELMEEFDLKTYAKSSPQYLSGGYKQRFILARTLMHSPKLIILDEPTVALDVQIRRELWKKISFLKEKGVTVLLTTHYLEEAEVLSDRVCIIDQGRIRRIDTPDNLKNHYKKENLEDVFIQLMEEERSPSDFTEN